MCVGPASTAAAAAAAADNWELVEQLSACHVMPACVLISMCTMLQSTCEVGLYIVMHLPEGQTLALRGRSPQLPSLKGMDVDKSAHKSNAVHRECPSHRTRLREQHTMLHHRQ